MFVKKAVVDLVSVVAIVASLIFVGMEVQQGTAATRSATVLQIKDAWVQTNLAIATNPKLARALAAARTQAWDEIPPEDRPAVSAFYRTLFHNWSNAYYQFQNGTLEEVQWIPHVREAEIALALPPIRKVWLDWNDRYDDPFRELLNGLIAEQDR